MTVLSGYHTRQGGMLAIIDVREGRDHGKGVTLIPQGTPPESGPELTTVMESSVFSSRIQLR